MLRKHARFQLWTDAPLNGEPPAELLAESLLTPPELFYVRCHGPVPVRDVLALAGIRDGAAHVELLGRDETVEGGCFGASVPLRQETLLAFEMNGAPLEPVHGFPLRAIVPGYIGARSVKWLERITLIAARIAIS